MVGLIPCSSSWFLIVLRTAEVVGIAHTTLRQDEGEKVMANRLIMMVYKKIGRGNISYLCH